MISVITIHHKSYWKLCNKSNTCTFTVLSWNMKVVSVCSQFSENISGNSP